MDEKQIQILEKVRQLTVETGLTYLSIDEVAKKLDLSKEEILSVAGTEEELVEKALDYERDCFKEIFDNNDFEKTNAIDILLIVSKEMSKRFFDITPSVTFNLKKHYPQIYHKHVEKRIEFIFDKIKVNLQKGVSQGMYRQDLSIELVARLYISRLIDLHNPDFFPPDQFSFETLFDVMFDNFIRGIANPTGMDYYEQKKKLFSL